MGQAQTKCKKKMKNKGRVKFEAREEYFVKNGGILLEKQIALSKGQLKGGAQLKIFTSKDIRKATDNYNPDLIFASRSYYTIYKVILEDRTVAVKTPALPNPELVDLFLTEASTLTVMNHYNIVRLCGCCLETFIPILVYEFFPNGALFRCLHSDVESSKCIEWADCLRVASDTAYALSYLHNALSKPVVHRDVQSISIILDHSFRAKLTNFVYSVSITPGEKPPRWPVEGTPGYIDPEYIETEEVTEMCDVYSFGVVMLELLTRKQPFEMARDGSNLADVFVSAVQKNCMMEMIDCKILEQASSDDIQRVAQLALACVAKKGDERPTMIDIVSELWNIQGREKKNAEGQGALQKNAEGQGALQKNAEKQGAQKKTTDSVHYSGGEAPTMAC